MISVRVYYTAGYWWFELVEMNPMKAYSVLDVLFRRRYRSMDDAKRCGLQALDKVRAERAERRQEQNEGN